MTATRKRRGTIDHSDLLDAAIALANRDGIDALSIRELAKRVDRPPMSLYAHFSSRDELSAQMAMRMLDAMDLPTDTAMTWQEALTSNMMVFYETLESNPALVQLLSRQRVVSKEMTRLAENSLSVMMAGGVARDSAITAYGVLFAHVLGCVVYQHPRVLVGRHRDQEEQDDEVKRQLTEFAKNENWPLAASAAASLSTLATRDLVQAGLSFLVAGIAATPQPSRAHRAI